MSGISDFFIFIEVTYDSLIIKKVNGAVQDPDDDDTPVLHTVSLKDGDDHIEVVVSGEGATIQAGSNGDVRIIL